MIGRIEEQKLLLSLLEEDEPQFVAVFGRRRIGKTYLVREVFQHRFTFQHTGVSNADLSPGTRKRNQLKFISTFHPSSEILFRLFPYGCRTEKPCTPTN